MTRAPIAWVLNLDAELELESGPRHTASNSLARAMSEARLRLRAMLPEDDVVLDVDPDERARDLEGRCFCPTTSALRRLERAGARIPDAPSTEVLRRVNERGFAFALHHLDRAARCEREQEVLLAIAAPGRWLLKRAFGFAGRGQRRIDVASEADRDWIRASLRRGALYVEPRVDIALEVALHGWLERDGRSARGAPTIQSVSSGGAWSESRLAEPGELTSAERDMLDATFDRVARALHDAGYFGPFGVDAFRYDGDRFTPLSEINARYTMAWGIGMGGWR